MHLVDDALIELIWHDYESRPEECINVLDTLANGSQQEETADPSGYLETNAKDFITIERNPLGASRNEYPADFEILSTKEELIGFLRHCLPNCSESTIESNIDKHLHPDGYISVDSVPIVIDTILDEYYTSIESNQPPPKGEMWWMNNDATMEAVEAKYALIEAP